MPQRATRLIARCPPTRSSKQGDSSFIIGRMDGWMDGVSEDEEWVESSWVESSRMMSHWPLTIMDDRPARQTMLWDEGVNVPKSKMGTLKSPRCDKQTTRSTHPPAALELVSDDSGFSDAMANGDMSAIDDDSFNHDASSLSFSQISAAFLIIITQSSARLLYQQQWRCAVKISPLADSCCSLRWDFSWAILLVVPHFLRRAQAIAEVELGSLWILKA